MDGGSKLVCNLRDERPDTKPTISSILIIRASHSQFGAIGLDRPVFQQRRETKLTDTFHEACTVLHQCLFKIVKFDRIPLLSESSRRPRTARTRSQCVQNKIAAPDSPIRTASLDETSTSSTGVPV